MRTGRFTRFFNVDLRLGLHVEYRHPTGGKLIAHKYGVATTGDIVCTGAGEIQDMRTVFEMAVVDHEALRDGRQLLSVDDVHHAAVDRLWTRGAAEAVVS